MWWSRYWKKFLEDMERDFEELERMMDEIFASMREEGEIKGPYVYGFSITIGPDGKPIIRKFGNVKPLIVEEAGYREPFVDIVVDDKANEVKVIAEIPGVRKEKIEVEATEKLVRIRAENGDRKYRTQVELPVEVDPKSARAKYNNGILEITLKPKEPIKEEGTKIKVE
ncbi:MAG: Hsp20/alpha crystallin family protein [Candidatus Korarchaeota archaeon]|nr:Hsp20/alpha crystallin family protein [Candidatus Korarchaeota archaeon]